MVPRGIAALLLLAACDGAAPARPVETPAKSARAPKRAPVDSGVRTPQALVFLEGADGPVRVRVEVAKDPDTRERGLMFRRQMDEDAGMVFVFDVPQVQSFWMKETYLPLDMIFIGADMRVAGVVENAEPLTLTSRSVELPSRYVLEVNAGFSRRHGIGPGAPVRFEGVE